MLQGLAQVGVEPSWDQARRCHDVLLAVTLFGSLPPPRVSCIIELTLDGGRCLDADCTKEGCLGNRLSQDAAGVRGIFLPHHKTGPRGTPPIVVKPLPAELDELLGLYLERCRSILADEANPRSVFVASLGGIMSPSTLSHYWQDFVLPAIGLGHLRFPPQLLRHIFICERLSAAQAANPVGPRHEDAALVMGNTINIWGRYRIDDSRAMIQRGLAQMPAWRQLLLGQVVAA